MLDIARLRDDTPGCAEVVHFNNAGAALQPRPVLAAVRDHLDLEARIGGYEAADAAAERLTAAYGSLARLIGAEPDEIAYTESATRAWDMAFYGVPFRPGDRILTTASEYGSNAIAFAHVARHHGVKVEVVPDDEHGQICLGALEAALGDDVHVAEQKERYRARREILKPALEAAGFRIDHSEAGLYLWATEGPDGWASIARLAELGIVAGPGEFYGEFFPDHVRFSLTANDERIAQAAARLAS